MNGEPEFRRVLEWMLPRWPEMAAWEQPELQAFYTDLQAYSAGSILNAVYRLWRAGREKPPRAGTVLAMLDELRISPERPIPERPAETPALSWEEFAEIHLGGRVSMWDHVRRSLDERTSDDPV